MLHKHFLYLLIFMLSCTVLTAQKSQLKKAAKVAGNNPVAVNFKDYINEGQVKSWCSKNGYTVVSLRKTGKRELKFGQPVTDGLSAVTIQETGAYQRALAARQRASRSSSSRGLSTMETITLGVIGTGLLLKGGYELLKGSGAFDAPSSGSSSSSSYSDRGYVIQTDGKHIESVYRNGDEKSGKVDVSITFDDLIFTDNCKEDYAVIYRWKDQWGNEQTKHLEDAYEDSTWALGGPLPAPVTVVIRWRPSCTSTDFRSEMVTFTRSGDYSILLEDD
jgi:hypothetical protein